MSQSHPRHTAWLHAKSPLGARDVQEPLGRTSVKSSMQMLHASGSGISASWRAGHSCAPVPHFGNLYSLSLFTQPRTRARSDNGPQTAVTAPHEHHRRHTRHTPPVGHTVHAPHGRQAHAANAAHDLGWVGTVRRSFVLCLTKQVLRLAVLRLFRIDLRFVAAFCSLGWRSDRALPPLLRFRAPL